MLSAVFALVDCDGFYVSCERVFAPRLRGWPVVVLSNNGGCVISRSREAKEIGVAMGAPFFEVRALLEANRAAVSSSNYELYGDMSRRVMQTLEEFAPGVMLLDLVPASPAQSVMSDATDRARARRLMQTLDHVNRQMGHRALRYAAAGRRHDWRMLSEHRSPRCTTRWSELLLLAAGPKSRPGYGG